MEITAKEIVDYFKNKFGDEEFVSLEYNEDNDTIILYIYDEEEDEYIFMFEIDYIKDEWKHHSTWSGLMTAAGDSGGDSFVELRFYNPILADIYCIIKGVEIALNYEIQKNQELLKNVNNFFDKYIEL